MLGKKSRSQQLSHPVARGLRYLSLGVLCMVLLGSVVTTSSHAASTNYVSLASIQKDIASFSKTLKATGSVSYAQNSSVADQILHATDAGVFPKPLASSTCFSNGFVSPESADMSECVWTNPTSDVTILLFGDSHIQQWLPTFVDISNQRGFRLVSLMHAGCGAAQLT
ncbi:MAG: SGNH hydrolase domain-containing protein, partial [Actinomycetes bacterium]